MKKELLYKLLLISSFIIFGLALRYVPSLPNFSSFIAIALFSGLLLPKSKYAYLLPFAVQLGIDLTIGVYTTSTFGLAIHIITMYLSLGLVILIGQKSSRKISLLGTLLSVTLGNFVFFLITNLGSWLQLPIYSKDLTGLTEAYIAALPFMKNSILSGLLFGSVLYGIYYVFTILQLKKQKQNI
jgi:hypothetical protein